MTKYLFSYSSWHKPTSVRVGYQTILVKAKDERDALAQARANIGTRYYLSEPLKVNY